MMDFLTKRGGPYASTHAGVGGLPNRSVDVPITSVFLVLFILGAAIHMTIFQVNRRRSHKYIMSGATFGFCMSRIVTCTLRLAWATHQKNVSLAIAAAIFVNAGVLILIIINLNLTLRLLRASHPKIGWHKSVKYGFIVFVCSIVILLIVLIFSIIQQSYTQNTRILRIDHDLALTGSTYFTVASFLPIPVLFLTLFARRFGRSARTIQPVEEFGVGGYRTKVAVALYASILICLGASFRCATAYLVRPRTDPAWYDSRAAFYTFNFTIEILVVYAFAIVRVDQRFWVPDGAECPGSYRVVRRIETEELGEKMVAV